MLNSAMHYILQWLSFFKLYFPRLGTDDNTLKRTVLTYIK